MFTTACSTEGHTPVSTSRPRKSLEPSPKACSPIGAWLAEASYAPSITCDGFRSSLPMNDAIVRQGGYLAGFWFYSPLGYHDVSRHEHKGDKYKCNAPARYRILPYLR
eukprot:6177895-Pleurochrysis_carterae.AAC.1